MVGAPAAPSAQGMRLVVTHTKRLGTLRHLGCKYITMICCSNQNESLRTIRTAHFEDCESIMPFENENETHIVEQIELHFSMSGDAIVRQPSCRAENSLRSYCRRVPCTYGVVYVRIFPSLPSSCMELSERLGRESFSLTFLSVLGSIHHKILTYCWNPIPRSPPGMSGFEKSVTKCSQNPFLGRYARSLQRPQ